MDPRHAVELIRGGSGTDFDPMVVEAFVDAIDG
jgi:response regulator RpfG family c-di-GMP phosphodiesterase